VAVDLDGVKQDWPRSDGVPEKPQHGELAAPTARLGCLDEITAHEQMFVYEAALGMTPPGLGSRICREQLRAGPGRRRLQR